MKRIWQLGWASLMIVATGMPRTLEAAPPGPPPGPGPGPVFKGDNKRPPIPAFEKPAPPYKKADPYDIRKKHYHPGIYRKPFFPWFFPAPVLVPPLILPPIICPPVVEVTPPPVYVAPAPPPPGPVVIWVRNSNGSKTPVKLQPADDGWYIGPKGEYYDGVPTEEQLRQIYGI